MSEFLKCDAEGCQHSETIAVITADMVGKPCPACGASLLTQEDFDFFDNVMRPSFEALAGLGLDIRAGEDIAPEQRVAVNYHDGEIRIQMPKSARF